ncbi:DUF308 domain-containing protein [Methanobrevibacter sp. TMH8]|uniref:DUF308 domain-containing protein n=1 Tax=Methanobrevibacter sp. TMH8 TaxID=2848611 RepID=UPI001CC92EDC|nr:DUF308 domain-containing protein [Methanobrevibacter sp. TMH8]MBZ9571161.1 DUF308 domain-containing protein [Methanobrevibacter sp. TMH8]
MENKTIVGILAIIFGLLIMIFPFMSQFVLSVIAGIGLLILGIFFLIQGASLWTLTKAGSIAYIIIGFLGMLVGIMLLGNVLLFGVLISLYLYIAGFMLLFAGLVGIFTRSAMMTKASSALMLILGIITIVLGYFALLSPVYVAIILGISLVIDGIAIAMGNYDGIIEE